MDYTQNTEIILKVGNLKASYEDFVAIDGVSLKVRKGEIVGLLGHNGAGKTTLLKTIVGIVPHTEGSIVLGNEQVDHLPVHERARKGIIYVPEGMQVFPFMSVEENLEVAAHNNRNTIKQKLNMVFELFPDLKRDIKKMAGHLSGGQQRMLVIARALMTQGKIFLLDDPFLGLTPKVINRLAGAIVDISRCGYGILLAGQHVKTILKLAHAAHLLVNGKLELSGKPDDLSNHPLLHKTLFGTQFSRDVQAI
ncbi:MAG TPA: ABC transporter ATP-binding protein [Deltaproteobacteria bacterium]|nr:ABC transporter ATP-binding protein [Deltaproteobacteria bacterium]